MQNKLGVFSVLKIKEAIQKDLGFKLAIEKVKIIMKVHLGLECKKTSSQKIYLSAHKNLVLRQMFVVALIKVME